jgi:arylformamidase
MEGSLGMKKRYDVTMKIEPTMQVYKNKPEKKPIFSVEDGLQDGKSYETTLTMNVHTGTHLDFPLHMQRDGATSTNFDPFTLLREVKVIEILHTPVITRSHLENVDIQPHDFLFIKTDNSFLSTFHFSFTYVDASAALYLVEKGIDGLGVDGLGIERDQPTHPTHHALMDASIWIIEGLRLADVPPGNYTMIALPLSIPNLDALPLRVLLEEKA